MICDVPQGSILGPLLFLIFINDLWHSTPLLDVILFADDTNLFYLHNNVNELFRTMNDELSHLNDWFYANKLSLNTDKTKYVLFHNAKSKDNWTDLISGVPQESVLGSLIFNIYLNDLFFFLQGINIEGNSELAIFWVENN